MDMINMEAEQRVEDNERLRKELGPQAAGTQIGMPPPVKILAGNKCDLKDDRAVTSRDGLEYARKHGCGFMETSAREMVNIEETFSRRRIMTVNKKKANGGRPGPSRCRSPSSSLPTRYTTSSPMCRAGAHDSLTTDQCRCHGRGSNPKSRLAIHQTSEDNGTKQTGPGTECND
jgi:hypothetical protein